MKYDVLIHHTPVKNCEGLMHVYREAMPHGTRSPYVAHRLAHEVTPDCKVYWFTVNAVSEIAAKNKAEKIRLEGVK